MIPTLVLNYSSPHEMFYKFETDFNGFKYPLNYVLSYKNLSPSYKSFVMSLSSHVDPNTTYFEAVKHDC